MEVRRRGQRGQLWPGSESILADGQHSRDRKRDLRWSRSVKGREEGRTRLCRTVDISLDAAVDHFGGGFGRGALSRAIFSIWEGQLMQRSTDDPGWAFAGGREASGRGTRASRTRWRGLGQALAEGAATLDRAGLEALQQRGPRFGGGFWLELAAAIADTERGQLPWTVDVGTEEIWGGLAAVGGEDLVVAGDRRCGGKEYTRGSGRLLQPLPLRLLVAAGLELGHHVHLIHEPSSTRPFANSSSSSHLVLHLPPCPALCLNHPRPAFILLPACETIPCPESDVFDRRSPT